MVVKLELFEMEWDWLPGQRCFQIFRMRSFIFYSIEIEKVNKRLQYFWSHLNDPVRSFRSKTFPASLTGVLWGRFYKALTCYRWLNFITYRD